MQYYCLYTVNVKSAAKVKYAVNVKSIRVNVKSAFNLL